MDLSLDPDHCYPALLARDARFDGQWFVGVKTTGIYCRPICRVRPPKRENCEFYASASLAEAARYRPCLKCRPELAPAARRWSAMDAGEVLAREAARWLDECAPETASLPVLAAHLGVSERHVRRVFTAVHGVAPLQYLQTRRLLLAKQLLTDTRLPVSEVALAAGFSSLRRFNAAFATQYRLSPTALRRTGGDPTDTATETAELRLDLRPPLLGTVLLQFLAARAVPGVEQVDIERLTLSRSVRLARPGQDDLLGWLTVRLSADGAERAQVQVRLSASLWPAMAALMPRLRRWLDLDADPHAIAAALGDSLGSSAEGLRLPGTLDRFELAIRAVLGQQVTVAAARTLATRLIARFGEPLPVALGAPEGITHAFPPPARLAAASVDDIASLGMPARRAQALITLAQQWPTLGFAQGRGSVQAAIAELVALPGIGPWTAHYMLMRGWSWPDAFLPGDVVLKQRLEHRAGRPLTPLALITAAEAFAPYRSYAVLQWWREASAAAPVKRTARPIAAAIAAVAALAEGAATSKLRSDSDLRSGPTSGLTSGLTSGRTSDLPTPVAAPRCRRPARKEPSP
ncbi:DNA-3-methyladenine glycosylase 2 family protein [Roseateles amylovorans]|uniref:DNA-3-methyladenine glycosylase II n=1 Tax=Roseateles amylovorans TaxID=2978473 RepID=A0ABY6B4J4_9BURK|nr:Ada metal-binding domain-containing protein [Roseateles amylovorans]UXH80283.1 helix-turn-helix domain-containing protein [Roseateles amylovorans]